MLKTFISNKLKSWITATIPSTFELLSSNYKLNDKIEIETFFSNWAFACINKRANAFANIENKLYNITSTEPKEITKHWIYDLLANPNVIAKLQWYEIKKLVQNSLDYYGNAYLYMEKNGGRLPQNIWFIPANDIQPIIVKNSIVEYKRISTNEIYYPEDIIHFRTLAINKDFKSSVLIGTNELLRAAFDSLLIDNDIRNVIRTNVIPESAPPFVLTSQFKVDQASIDRMKREWNTKLPNHKIAAILEDNMQISALNSSGLTNNNSKSISQMLLEYASSEDAAKLIAAIFGVPFGLLDSSSLQSYATSKTHESYFAKYTIEPILNNFESTLNMYFQQLEPNIVFGHDLISYKDMTEDRLQLEFELKYQLITRNEAREYLGYTKVDGLDEYFGSSTIDNNTEESAQNDNTDNNADDNKQLKNKNFDELQRVMLWKSIDLGLANLRTQLKNKFSKYIKEYITSIANNYGKKKNIVNKSIETETLNAYNLTSGIVEKIIEKAFNSAPAVITKEMRNKLMKLVLANYKDNVNISIETLFKNVNSTIEKARLDSELLTEDETNKKIKEYLDNLANNISGSRALNIAVSNTTNCYTKTQAEIGKILNKKMVWLSQRDSSVRPSHSAADGQEADEKGLFHVGNDVMTNPGGGSSAEENAGCRCYLIYQDK